MSFVLGDVTARLVNGALVDLLAMTIAVVGATEQLYRVLGKRHPEQWESLERSAETFADEHVVALLASADPEFKRAVTTQRNRKLIARAGALQLVESDHNQRARWAAVTLPEDAPIPIAEDVGERLGEATYEAEERLFEHLGAVTSTEPLVIAGQVVGLLCASECLLALLPSNQVAAFCVQLASLAANESPP